LSKFWITVVLSIGEVSIEGPEEDRMLEPVKMSDGIEVVEIGIDEFDLTVIKVYKDGVPRFFRYSSDVAARSNKNCIVAQLVDAGMKVVR
jgi:hypothetical protein